MPLKTKNIPPFNVIEQGGTALIRSIGPSKTIRFLMSLTTGRGDSVKELKKFWGDQTVDNVHRKLIKKSK